MAERENCSAIEILGEANSRQMRNGGEMDGKSEITARDNGEEIVLPPEQYLKASRHHKASLTFLDVWLTSGGVHCAW